MRPPPLARSKAKGRSDLDRKDAIHFPNDIPGPAVLQHPRGSASGAATFLPEWNLLLRSDRLVSPEDRSIALSKPFCSRSDKAAISTLRQAVSSMCTTPQIMYLGDSGGS